MKKKGLDETLTLHRLGVFAELGVRFKTTNVIQSVMAVTRSEDRPRGSLAGNGSGGRVSRGIT